MSIFGNDPKENNNSISSDGYVFNVGSEKSLRHSTISEDLTIKGDLNGDDYIELSGKVYGNIKTEKIDVRKSGLIDGTLECEVASIEGQFEGNLNVESLYLRSTSKIKGEIRFKSIDVQPGAIINGQLIQK